MNYTKLFIIVKVEHQVLRLISLKIHSSWIQFLVMLIYVKLAFRQFTLDFTVQENV